jgi:Flp pilus assembly protein TadD
VCFARARESGGENAELLEHIALAQTRLNCPELALAAWSSALALAPGSIRLTEGKCSALYVLGKWADVVAVAIEGLRGTHGAPQLHKYAGVAFLEQGSAAEACHWLDQGTSVAPEDSEMWLYAGMAWAARGESGEAIKRFDRGLKIEPGGERLLTAKAAALSSGTNERKGKTQ